MGSLLGNQVSEPKRRLFDDDKLAALKHELGEAREILGTCQRLIRGNFPMVNSLVLLNTIEDFLEAKSTEGKEKV